MAKPMKAKAKAAHKKAPAPKKAAKIVKKAPKVVAKPKKAATPSKPTPEPKKRRQLERRDTDEQCDRVLNKKLGHILKSTWVSKVDEEGNKIEDLVKKEIRHRRDAGGYIENKFWNDIFEGFDLSENPLAELPPPETCDVPDDELLDCIAQLHNENHIKAIAWPLEGYLNHCDYMGETAFYGLLQAVVPSQDLPGHLAVLAQVAVMKFWERMGGVEKFHAKYWPVAEPMFDATLAFRFETLSEGNMTVKSFYLGHRAIFALFGAKEHMVTIFSKKNIVEEV